MPASMPNRVSHPTPGSVERSSNPAPTLYRVSHLTSNPLKESSHVQETNETPRSHGHETDPTTSAQAQPSTPRAQRQPLKVSCLSITNPGVRNERQHAPIQQLPLSNPNVGALSRLARERQSRDSGPLALSESVLRRPGQDPASVDHRPTMPRS